MGEHQTLPQALWALFFFFFLEFEVSVEGSSSMWSRFCLVGLRSGPKNSAFDHA